MDKGLLDRFYRGECSQEEVQHVLQWFQDNKPSPEQEQELQALWQEAGAQGTLGDETQGPDRIFSRIKAQLEEPQQQETSGTIRFLQPQQSQHFWFKAAAAVLLPLCLLWAIVEYASHGRSATPAYVTVSTAPGVKKKINLPDGSVITLNSGGKVSFRKGFASDKREIVLRGEAFFEVAKDSLRPFIVHTGHISTQALGTSFNINYSLCDTTITVALATGVVKIDEHDKARKRLITQLAPGQQLSYNKVTQQHSVVSFDREEVLGWKQGVLSFTQANMEQTIRKLENWYGVDIKVDTQDMPDEAWNYTGEYDSEALDKVLEGIGFVKDFSFDRTGKEVRIVFN